MVVDQTGLSDSQEHWSIDENRSVDIACSACMTAKRKHDIAYGCFLVPWAACLVAATTPTDIGTVGFFVLLPLMMGSLAAIPFGVYYSIVLWRDVVPPLLSILTIIMVVIVVTAVYDQMALGSVTESAESYAALKGRLVLIGIPVLILEGSWFFWRRRAYPKD